MSAPPPSRTDLSAGLQSTIRDVPLRTGYAQLGLGFDQGLGGWARGEVGVHVLPDLGVFGFAQESTRSGLSAGVGARLNFGL